MSRVEELVKEVSSLSNSDRKKFSRLIRSVRKARKRQEEDKRRFEYEAFIRSPEWKAIREQAFEYHGRECSECGTKESLHVHHLTYKGFGGKETMGDLQIVCKGCHDAIHKGRKGGKSLRPDSEDYVQMLSGQSRSRSLAAKINGGRSGTRS